MLTEIQLSLNEPLIRPLVPEKYRVPVDILWRLDARLQGLCFAGREPALRQIRLAWWRDALAALGGTNARVPDEPLLVEVAAHLLPLTSTDDLAALAEAKLAALTSDWAVDDVMAAGQALFAATAHICGDGPINKGGSHFALSSFALAVQESGVRDRLFAAALATPLPTGQPRALAVLDRLALAIARAGGHRRRGPEQALILRVGLFGR